MSMRTNAITRQRGFRLFGWSLLTVWCCLLLWPAGVARAVTTFTVTNTNDSGAGSLRQAILAANARPRP